MMIITIEVQMQKNDVNVFFHEHLQIIVQRGKAFCSVRPVLQNTHDMPLKPLWLRSGLWYMESQSDGIYHQGLLNSSVKR